MSDLDKRALFHELGFGGDPAPYERALAADGLSRPEKPRIHASKRGAVEESLSRRFRRVCGRGDCQRAAAKRPDGREIVLASTQEACEVCGGSANRAAVDRLVEALGAAGWSKLCVVGGSPGTRTELGSLVGGRLDLRLIEGTGVKRTSANAAADLAWADLVVIWGGTELDHKVSNLYKGPRVILVHKRGIAHLADEAVRAAKRAAGKPK